MKEVDNLTCQPLNDTECELFINNRSTRRFISGTVLEKVFSCGDFYLIIMTDDCPHEECVIISLLNEYLAVLDSAVIGAPLAAGILQNQDIEIESSDRVMFRFGDNIWHVIVKAEPVRWIPWLPDVVGVYRSWDRNYPFFGFSRHFVIKRDPL